MGLAAHEGDVRQPLLAHAPGQIRQILRHNVLREHTAVRPERPRESATLMPGSRPSAAMICSDSLTASRSVSVAQIGLMISATGRSGLGKALAGAPGGASG